MSEPYWVALGGSQLDYKDEWAGVTQYTVGDIVVHNGVTYMAVNPSLGSEPPTMEEIQGPGAPTGALLAFAGASAPTGYLLCDGAAVSRTTYAALFAVIGSAYGVGDGSSTFNLPDMRGRGPVGKGSHAWVNALGVSDGIVDEATRRPEHKHSASVNDPGHAHMFGGGSSDGGPNPNIGTNSSGIWYGTSTVGTGITVAVGPGGAPTVDYAPYLTVNYIIKT